VIAWIGVALGRGFGPATVVGRVSHRAEPVSKIAEMRFFIRSVIPNKKAKAGFINNTLTRTALAPLTQPGSSSWLTRRHCKQAKIDALREYKGEILEAHR